MSQREDFSGKVALVSGGARGIGLEIALSFAACGASVAIADIDRDAGGAAVSRIEEAGAKAVFVPTDLTRTLDVKGMVASAAEFGGRLDFLVNNARAGARLGVLEETEGNWDLTLSVGLRAAFFAAQAAAKVMSGTGGGSVINISSVAGVLATNESPSYHAAKAGLLQLTRYLAVSMGPQRIRVNAVLPGLIVQGHQRQRFDASENAPYKKLAAAYQPMDEVGSEADVAEAVMYLCSARAKYVSGASLVVDGGATVQEQFGMLIREVL